MYHPSLSVLGRDCFWPGTWLSAGVSTNLGGGRNKNIGDYRYKRRNVVERAINRLKDFRAVATRYEQRGHNYLAAVTVATIIIWLL
jgi:transposase